MANKEEQAMNTAERITADKIKVTLEDGTVKIIGGKRATRAEAVVVSSRHYERDGQPMIYREYACRQTLESALQYARTFTRSIVHVIDVK
jgi:hypothetical protein